MKRPLKISLITLGTLVALFIVALALVPLLFKDRIAGLVRTEINRRVDATVDFDDVDLTLISSFPNLGVEVTNLEVNGKGRFEGVQLLSVRTVAGGIDLLALLTEDKIEIQSVELDRPDVHVVVTDDGAANYDILAETPEQTSSESLSFDMKRYRITDGSVLYEEPGVQLTIGGLSHRGSLSMAGSVERFASQTEVDELSVELGGVRYLSKAKASLDLDATVHSDEERLVLDRARLAINELAFGGSGSVGWGGDGLVLNLEAASEQGLPIKALVSAVPNAYAADFKGLKASGSFSISAETKGQLGPSDDDVPSFSVKASVRDGKLKYPDLPLAISDLELDAKVDHPGGNLDKVSIDVSKYSIAAGQSHASGHLRVTRPLSKPNVDLLLDGRFDLAEIAKAYPISDVQGLGGVVEARIDLSAKGEQIAKLTGQIDAKNVTVQATGQPEVRISAVHVTLSPQTTKIDALQARVGVSDVDIRGSASPLTTFFGEGNTVRANASLASKRLRVEDFVGEEGSNETKKPSEAQGPLVLPENLDAKLDFDVATLTYGDLELRNFKGSGRIKDRKLLLDGVRADGLGGTMRLDGSLVTKPGASPTFDMTYSVDGASFAKAFDALPSMQAYAPIAKFLNGRFSTNLRASGKLGDDLSPKLDSIAAGGLLAAVQTTLGGDFKPLQVLSSAVPAIPRPIGVESFKTRFAIEDGAVQVKPFTVTTKGLTLLVSGRHGLDEEMKYQVSTDVPIGTLTSKLASEARGLGVDLAKLKTVGVQADLTGSIQSPRVSVKVDTAALRGIAAGALSTELAEQSARAVEEAKAAADRLLAEAEKQAARIRSEAKLATEKLRKEGYARADQLEREAKGNPLKEIAAKEAAKRIRSETDKRVAQLNAEADQKAKQVVAEAQKRASQMVAEAQTKSAEATKKVEGKTAEKVR